VPRPPCLGGPPTSPELELRIGVGGSEWCQEWSHCQCPKSQAREMRREWAAPSSSDLDVGPAPQLSSAQDWGSSVGVRAAPGSDIQPGPKLRLRGAETPATRRKPGTDLDRTGAQRGCPGPHRSEAGAGAWP
jgi:hypothetical protein